MEGKHGDEREKKSMNEEIEGHMENLNCMLQA